MSQATGQLPATTTHAPPTLEPSAAPWVGIANSPYVETLLGRWPAELCFIEVAYEQLKRHPRYLRLADRVPLILHCSSLSLAGSIDPHRDIVAEVKAWLGRTRSPWLGEHLAFLEAPRAPGDPARSDRYDIGFTVCPQLSEQTAERVAGAVERFLAEFDRPLLVENPPVYFVVPGAEMSLVELISEVCRRSRCRLLMDLTHFYVAGRNLGFDPFRELLRLPLDRVDEVHISGCTRQCGVWWDDHSVPAPAPIFQLLRILASVRKPMAVTLEYNWSSVFPLSTLLQHARQVRSILDG